MPRINRGFAEDHIYHIINRGNNKARIFHKAEDYLAFIRLMGEAKERCPIKIFGYCIMPNHFHILAGLSPADNLSRWMQWLMTSHVRRYRAYYGGVGHVWQGRFKSFIVKADAHLLAVSRYVEGNPVRGGLVGTALEWTWSSHLETAGIQSRMLTSELPIELPADWTHYVDTPMNALELEKIRISISKQRPYGDDAWRKKICGEYHLESTLRLQGRPKKEKGTGYFLVKK